MFLLGSDSVGTEILQASKAERHGLCCVTPSDCYHFEPRAFHSSLIQWWVIKSFRHLSLVAMVGFRIYRSLFEYWHFICPPDDEMISTASFQTNPWTLVITTIAAYTAYCVVEIIYRVYFHPLAQFSGPWKAKISEGWFSDIAPSGFAERTLAVQHDRYSMLSSTDCDAQLTG